jgi:hypothetical protein
MAASREAEEGDDAGQLRAGETRTAAAAVSAAEK